MKTTFTLLLLCIATATYSQNWSKYEAPQYFSERPYDGIIGEVDSMVTYTFAAPKIHRDSALKPPSLVGKCIAIKRQYFDPNGRRTLLENLELNTMEQLQVTFRQVTERDHESLPLSHTITQDGNTAHYILQSRTEDTEIYKTARPKGGIPSINTQREMIVVYENDSSEFDMGDDHIEIEFNVIVTTTIKDPSGLTTIQTNDYGEEGYCHSTRTIKEDGAGNKIYDSNYQNDNPSGIFKYTNTIKEDEYGNYLQNLIFDGKDILQSIEITQFYYRTKSDEKELT